MRVKVGEYMRKKIGLLILSVVFLVSCAAVFAGCNKTNDNDLDLVGGRRPDYPSLIDGDIKSVIQAALDENADESVKKQAVIALYDIANASRKNTSLSLMLQNSVAGVALMSDVDIVMHAFNLKSGNRWYYQLATDVDTGSNFGNNLITIFAGLLKVAYTDANGDYYYSIIKGQESNCDCTLPTFPYATFDLTQKPVKHSAESFKEELHYSESIHEINNMIFCEEIIADGSKITYDAENGVYKVEFSVDMNADYSLLKDWYALAQKDMQVSGNSINYYNYYNAVLEIWDNGYAKSYSCEYDRDAGTASGKTKDEFTYLWTESEIMSLLREDGSIEASALMNTVEEYIEYYSNPETVAAKMSGTLIGLIVAGVLIGIIIVGSISAAITVNVLIKKGKLPKLAAKREAKKARREEKKRARMSANESPCTEDSPENDGVNERLEKSSDSDSGELG